MISLPEAVFEWAAQQPHKTALVYNEGAHSYRWFADAIATARGAFAAEGLAGAGVVVLAISNLVDFWVASLALRSLGLTGVLIPNVDALPGLGLPDIRAVVTTPNETWPGLTQACAGAGLPRLVTNLRGAAPLGLTDGPQHRDGGFSLLTSGTTGAARKVLNEAAWEAEFLRRRWEIIEAGRDSVVAMFELAPSTGTGYRNPAGAWFAGATAVFDQGRGPHQCLRHPGLTHATIVPPVLARVLAAPPDAFPRSEILRLSVTSGTITRAQIAETKARVTPHLFNWLGSTETQITAHTRIEMDDDHRWHRLLPGVEVVDNHDLPVAPGEVGRMRVSVAGGPDRYWREPENTAAFFRGGYFYPGDLARSRADGRIALQGRETSVINVGGWKVSPEPAEEQLREALSVTGACLVSAQDAAGEERLHLVLETPAPLPLERVGPALRAALPGWDEVSVHFTTELPRNALGKLLRRAVTDRLIAARIAGDGPAPAL
ncbi:MAG TPA: class I adenylate-forming enzyme family protein [Caulobacteraceae bacterium]|jgi:acyl-coenzyme A synthetase/AMP-(fatty) acid ligase